MELFEKVAQGSAPLADRMRPRSLDEVVGQEHLLGSGKILTRLASAERLPSMLFWGPPGTGKTTLARILAQSSKAFFEPFSAVLGGVPELRKLLAAAKERRYRSERTVLFVDEIHRFNKGQQDALLPFVEDGTVTLIGATTENPSFAVNAALLSRARVFRVESASEEALLTVLERALTDSRGMPGRQVEDEALRLIAAASHGDVRRALSLLETVLLACPGDVALGDARECLGDVTIRYDRAGEEHYNVVSAFIKSLRGSDPDAAIYWMMRMVAGGEDPAFITRRMIIFASEDIGNADPRALELAVATDAALHRLGMPEAQHALAQCCLYLAVAAKSNAAYRAFVAAAADVSAHGAIAVPMHLANAATSAMKDWGYGQGYRYPHDEGGFAAGVSYMPEALQGKRYYEPSRNGLEIQISEKLERLRIKS